MKKQDSKVFNLLVKARDEAHRFAIKANRSAKRKAMHKSALDTISGIGPKTKEALFTKYKSINGVKGVHLMGHKQEKEIATVISHFKR